MLSKQAGIIVAIIAAAIITALLVYGLGVTGEEAINVNDAAKP